MYVDRNLLVSDEQALTVSAPSTYSIDLGAAKAIWRGRPAYMVIIIDTAVATMTSINFLVVTDTEETLSTPTTQIETGAIAAASLTTNRAPIIIPLASAIGTQEQFLGMYYTVVTTGTCTVTAFVALEPFENT